MKPSEIYRMFSPQTWVLGGIAAVCLLLIAWWLVIGGPAHDRRAAAQARADAAYASGRADAAADAATAVGANAEGDAATNRIQRENNDAIDKASDAGTAVPATAGALRSGLCRYESYRQAPECLQQPGPR